MTELITFTRRWALRLLLAVFLVALLAPPRGAQAAYLPADGVGLIEPQVNWNSGTPR